MAVRSVMRGTSWATLLLLTSCASHNYTANDGHQLMARRQYGEAAQVFLREATKSRSNELLYLLDASIAFFAERRYQDAIDTLLKAEKMAEIKDYTSLSEEGASLLTNDSVKSYKGEDFEKVLINVYLALSFGALGKLESAQVEARKINLILYRMIHDGKRNYEESPFARYLSALIWEAAGEWNSAYVDYQYVQKLNPDYPGIGADLIYTAHQLKFQEDEARWRTRYSAVNPRPRRRERAEIIIFFERGQGPIKVPRDGAHSTLPRFVARSTSEVGARVKINNRDWGPMRSALNIEEASIRYLEDRISKLIARKFLGAAVKGAVAAGVGAKSDSADMGFLLFQVLMAADQADLRSWRSLPAEIQMLRIPVDAGRHFVVVDVLGPSGNPLRQIEIGEVVVNENQKVFLTAR